MGSPEHRVTQVAMVTAVLTGPVMSRLPFNNSDVTHAEVQYFICDFVEEFFNFFFQM